MADDPDYSFDILEARYAIEASTAWHAYLNQRKIYLKTNVYLKPECWSREGAQVINHPQSNELNAMLYEYILYLDVYKRQVTGQH